MSFIMTGVGSVTLPNPVADELIDKDAHAITRRTRGGDLRQLYAWAVTDTVSVNFVVLNETERDALITFLDDNKGRAITVASSIITGAYYYNGDIQVYCTKDGCSYSVALVLNK